MAPPTLSSFAALCRLVEQSPAGTLYVRYSEGPEADRAERSRDYESGLPLPGLSANSLTPEPWWTRPPEDWVARRLASYAHLGPSEGRRAWVLAGRVAGRGPDNEPLLTDVEPVALLTDGVVAEACTRYRAVLDAGNDSRRELGEQEPGEGDSRPAPDPA
jgi:hypothetical protein